MNEENFASSRVRVLVTEPDAYDDRIRSSFPDSWECVFRHFANDCELVEWAKENPCEIVIGRLGLAMDHRLFQANSALKVLATPTTGIDHIDILAAADSGVRVLSLRGEIGLLEKITSTAEHAWALLLACTRQLPELFSRTRSGIWSRDSLDLRQMSGQALGIIGIGRLGRMLADYGRAFRMQVACYDPYVTANQLPSYVRRVSLEELLSSSDHVMMTATYLPGDPVILGREQLLSMKPGANFINVARGELVDEEALVEAVDSGILRGVGIDVLPGDSRWSANEQVNSALLEQARHSDKILITPHVGGYAIEAVSETRWFLIKRLDQIINEELKGA